MRDVPAIWEAWRSGLYVGDTKPSTRVTVEEAFYLRPTSPVVGQWQRGPARWYQREDPVEQIETEIPGVLSINISRSTDPGAGSCDIAIRNVTAAQLGAIESPAGQLSDIGHYTPERGESQEAKARWGHSMNRWYGVLAPNALIRTYQGFGGHDKTIPDAVADGNIVLNGVWLVDDVTIGTEGTITLRCRDMSKLLIDQQLFPPLVPTELYPLLYQRYRIEEFTIPADPPSGVGDFCHQGRYTGSSTDETYGAFDARDTGHPGSEAFDMSFEPDVGPIPGAYSHQKSYWLSEPKGGPIDEVWIEFDLGGEVGAINQIYYHSWKGSMEGRGCHLVKVSVREQGEWAPSDTNSGGVTDAGIPYVSTFVPGNETRPGDSSNLFALPRDYHADRVRLTVTNLLLADDFPYGYGDPDFHAGGFRGGARKIMACFSQELALDPTLVFAGASIPFNNENRSGYWQVRSNGRIWAFGDARVYPPQDDRQHIAPVIAMTAHPSGAGYWTLDTAGRVLAGGQAAFYGDLADAGRDDFVDIAPTPTGDGYWLLRNDGSVHSFGDATDHAASTPRPGGAPTTMPSGAQVLARSIESHPTTSGYWILWTDGIVSAHNLTHHGNADRTGFYFAEYVASIRRTSTGAGYWITSGRGIVQNKGDAPHHGNATGGDYDSDQWPYQLCWDLLPVSEGQVGYYIQRANGTLEPRGDFKHFGSIGEGKGELRYDGNYKDYADIIRDLLLWGGFYFYKNPQPEAEQPDVYGNIETTGAWSTQDPLPAEMFDKRPIMDAINDVRSIVGYLFYIDAEGAARFEAPNWWQMGNFLNTSTDGARTPFPYMPEIDERVQLTSHSVIRSAASARSEIIIATEYPYATVTGIKPNEAIVKTRIVGSTAADLKGMISPFIWPNGKILNPAEQRTMAELVDMQIWFQRRTASVNCVANPLIDVNDQIRIIERQTGEVYVHYVKAIQFSHDVQSGSFTMSLTTYWLGGTPYGQAPFILAAAMHPSGDGYWHATITGDVYAHGVADLYPRNEPDSHQGWVTGLRSTPSGQGYWTVDQNGKIITYGDAVHHGNAHPLTQDNTIPASVPINDMAVTPSGDGYWLIEQDGTVHCFGDAVFYGETNNGGRRIASGSPAYASSIESHPTTQGYWVLWSDGHIDAFNLPDYGDATLDTTRADEVFAVLRRTPDGGGYYAVSGGGDNFQAFGNAEDLGDGFQYPDSQWAYGLVWEILVAPNGAYGLLRADGELMTFGEFPDVGPMRVSAYDMSWALVSAEAHQSLSSPTEAFAVSAETMEFLKKTGSPSANNAAVNAFSTPTSAALEGTGI